MFNFGVAFNPVNNKSTSIVQALNNTMQKLPKMPTKPHRTTAIQWIKQKNLILLLTVDRLIT